MGQSTILIELNSMIKNIAYTLKFEWDVGKVI